MNKKLLLGAALLVGMGVSFTSCVDSTESASVTAVREAKAEQLKSIADLNKAQAQAALILAQAEQAAQAANQAYQEAQATQLAAEAEYLKAQATLLKAQALVAEAEAKAKEAQSDIEKERWAQELAERQEAMKQADLDYQIKEQQLKDMQAAAEAAEKLLEKQLAQLQTEIDRQTLSNKILDQTYQNMVAAAKNEEDAAYATEYGELKDALNTAADNLITCQKSLADAKADMIKLEAHFVSLKLAINTNIERYEKQNANNDLNVAKYQAVIDALGQYAGQEITADMVADALTAYENAQKATEDAEEAKEAKYEALNGEDGALEVMNNSNYIKSLYDLINDSYGSYLTKDVQGNSVRVTFQIRDIYWDTAPADAYGKYALYVEESLLVYPDWQPFTKSYYVVSDYFYDYNIAYTTETPGVPAEDPDPSLSWPSVYPVSYRVYESNLNLVDDGAALDKWLEYKQKAVDYDANVAYNLDDLANDLAKAKAELDGGTYNDDDGKAVTVKADDSLRALYTAAKTAYDTAKANYETAVDAIPLDATYGYDPEHPELANSNMRQTALWKAWDAVKDDAEKAKDALKKLNDAVNATVKADAILYGGTYKNDKGEDVTVKTEDSANSVLNGVWIDGVEVLGAYANLNNGISAVNQATEDYNAAVNNNANNAESLEEAKELVAKIKAEAPENQKNIEAVNEAELEYAKAQVAYNTAYKAEYIAQTNYDIISMRYLENLKYGSSYVVDGTGNSYINQTVGYANQQINYYKGEIESINNLIDQEKAKLDKIEAGLDPSDNQFLYEAEVAYAQAKIDEAQAKLDLAQQRYDDAKAELESFVKNHEEK